MCVGGADGQAAELTNDDREREVGGTGQPLAGLGHVDRFNTAIRSRTTVSRSTTDDGHLPLVAGLLQHQQHRGRAARYARWWPVMANLAVIPALLLVYRGLGGAAGRRTAWLAVAIFLAGNWIGQDYFSPQSMAYLLYLLIIGVVLQFTAHDRGLAPVGATRPGRWSVAIALVATAAARHQSPDHPGGAAHGPRLADPAAPAAGGVAGRRSVSHGFALPFLAWYAALAIWPTPAGATVEPQLPMAVALRRRQGVVVVVVALLLAGFAFGYYGKDAYYQFSGDEVAASGYILDNAPEGTLLVTVSSNYPGLWRNYERVTPVPIEREPAESLRAVLNDPVTTMVRWLSGDQYTEGYILLTRSQEREVEALGELPPGAYAELRRTLDESPQFETVWVSANATVYQLAERSR